MAASVWMKSSNVATPSERVVALTMPCVTVCDRPTGLPMASTTSPTRSRSERPERRHRQVLEVDAQHGEVRIGIAPDDAGVRNALVRELHPDGVGVRDDVMVRHDVAVVVDDDPGAEAVFDTLSVARPRIPKQLVERRGCDALGDHARRIYVHHRRGRALDRICVRHAPRVRGR